MMQLLFPTPVIRTQLGLTDEERQVLKEKTLAVYGELNPDRKPWSRLTRESLESMDPVFADLFARIKAVTSEAFGIGIASITGREVVQFKGDFVPPHVESAHLSAIYWIDGDAHPDHARGEHDGSLVLQSPIGPFGSKALPVAVAVNRKLFITLMLSTWVTTMAPHTLNTPSSVMRF